MSKKVKMDWVIFKTTYEERDYLQVDLNGGMSKMIAMEHEGFEASKASMKAEIEFHESFSKVTVVGRELLD